MTHVKCVAYFLILANDDNDDESISSDESLSIEFPPPPSEFSSSPVIDNACQFQPVKNSFVQTTIIRSDSGKTRKKSISLETILFISILFYSFNHHHKSRRILSFVSFACFVVTLFEYALCFIPFSGLKKLTIQ
jgi:hypothetical protein